MTPDLCTGRLVQARTQKYNPKPKNIFKAQIMPEKERKLGLKNLAMLPSYFDIFVHLRQKARLRPELSPKFL